MPNGFRFIRADTRSALQGVLLRILAVLPLCMGLPFAARADGKAPARDASDGASRICRLAPAVVKPCPGCTGPDRVAGVVEKVCDRCDVIDFIDGTVLERDWLTVRLTAPPQFADLQIEVGLILEGGGSRAPLPKRCAQVAFPADQASIDAREVWVHGKEISPLP